ncbi:MAG: DUF11 domain-containing protein [Planctomycetales bacterium]|nr:DUF11 domain-containing protein [Planctomycetales bacterium]
MLARSSQLERRSLLVFAGCLLAISGCAQIRLPAIDPTGQSIFLPSPYSTTLETPCAGLPKPSCLEPAWEAPPLPPPCVEPGPALPVFEPLQVAPPIVATPAPPRTKHPHLDKLKHKHDQLGHITLTPTKVIAPVGGEVILTAGLCDPSGLLVTREPVRWIMTNDSVGHFVEVGDDERSHLLFASSNDSKLLSGSFAEGRTSAKRHVITRGTPSELDDLTLLAGQAWASVTSPVEGISYVTVIAPEATIWSERRQTATVHWIDAQWSFPQPSVVQAGSTAELTTVVTRTSGEAPPNYLVRYEIAGDSPARFPGGQTAVDVPVDGSGRATIALVSPPGVPGVSQVKMQIVRADVNGTRLTITEGWTSVTWSAPALDVAIAGPSVGSVGAAIVYRVTVSNPGDIPVTDIAAAVDLPAGISYISSSPTAQLFGNRVEWRLGELAGGGRLELQMNVRPEAAQNYRLTARALGAGGLQAESFVDTQVFEPSLDVQMQGPEQAVVGDRITYRVLVKNTGQFPLTNVVLHDRFDEGLQHSEGQPSPIDRSLGSLQPGEERPVAVTFIVRRPGRWCHVLDVQANGQSKSVQACVTVSEPAAPTARIQVRKTGPGEARVGDTVKFVVDVVNTGEATVRNLRIIDELAPAFDPTNATEGWDPTAIRQGRFVWNVPELPPGRRTGVEIQAVCVQANGQAISSVTVTADPGISESVQVTSRVLPRPATTQPAPPAQPRTPPSSTPTEQPRPATPTPGPSGTSTGGLSVSIADTRDPANVNDTIGYTISVANNRNVEDRNVRVRIVLPDGLRFQRISRSPIGPSDAVPLQPQFSSDGRTIELPEVQTVRAGETLPPLSLQVTATRAGRFTVQVEATSLRTPAQSPATDAEETTVFAP